VCSRCERLSELLELVGAGEIIDGHTVESHEWM